MLWERRERDFRTHPAAASIAAGLAVTLRDLLLHFAVNAGEARWTGAGVAALAGVHAPGPVGARLVVCAVVQVCEDKYQSVTTAVRKLCSSFCRGETEAVTHLDRKRCRPSLPCRCSPQGLYRYHVCRLDGVYTRHKRVLASRFGTCLHIQQQNLLIHKALLVH